MPFSQAWQVALAPMLVHQQVLGLVEGLTATGALARLADPLHAAVRPSGFLDVEILDRDEPGPTSVCAVRP
jgi:hypothetical protein